MIKSRSSGTSRVAEEKSLDGYPGKEGGDGKDGSRAKKKGRKAPIIIGGLILVVLFGAGITLGALWIVDSINYVSTDNASIAGNQGNVSSQILGRIKSVTVEQGTEVEAGQLLVLLDDVDLRAQEAQATSSLDYARKNLALAGVNLKKTKDDFDRAEKVFKAGGGTQEQHNHAASALETANAEYSIAQTEIDIARAKLGVIETQLLNTRIVAPISGTIAKKPLMPGELVQPGQTIISISDLKNIWVIANFEETKIDRIKLNAPVDITVDAYSSYQFKGRVVLISAAIVPPPFSIGEFTKTTQRIPVKIEFTDVPEGMVLLPGMSVEVKIKS